MNVVLESGQNFEQIGSFDDQFVKLFHDDNSFPHWLSYAELKLLFFLQQVVGKVVEEPPFDACIETLFTFEHV